MSKLIEFTGTPDAGKTTVISKIKEVLEERNNKVILLGEANGLELPPQNLRDSLAYNEWVGENACKGILKALEENPDIILVDRGIIDFRFWNYLYQRNGKATEEEVKELQAKELFQDKRLIPDLLVAVTVSIDEAINRNRKLVNKRNWVENHNLLFEEFYSSYRGTKVSLDTTRLSKEQVKEEVLKMLKEHNLVPETEDVLR